MAGSAEERAFRDWHDNRYGAEARGSLTEPEHYECYHAGFIGALTMVVMALEETMDTFAQVIESDAAPTRTKRPFLKMLGLGREGE